MAAPDLQGPYEEFIDRLNDIRLIVCAVEAAYRMPAALTSVRVGVDLSTIGPTTSTNANSMALVFLASSYEEFVREEISECARLLCSKYPTFPDDVRHGIRRAYWETTLQRLSRVKTILTKSAPKVPDAAVLGRIRLILDAAQLFVLGDDSTKIDATTTVHHSNNFRPRVVDEISGRIGVMNLIRRTADGSKIKTYFGVSTAAVASNLLYQKLDEFYDRRNEIVHSLSSTSGFGVDFVLDWISLFEAVAESMKDTLSRAIANW